MSTYPSMMRHMVGKKDKAGRLLNTEQRMLTAPNAEYWNERADEETATIAKMIGKEKYNEFIQALPTQADEWTNQAWAMALMKARKFVEVNYLKFEMPDLITATLAPIVPQRVSL